MASKYKWRHNNDVIVIDITVYVPNKIPYEMYISEFSYFEN